MSSDAKSGSARSQYLSFFLRDEEYGIDILRVRELIEYCTITRMPSMPKTIRGVLNLRGRVVPVIDMGPRFGLGETEITKWTCIVMLEATMEGEATVVGVLVDRVSQVIELDAEQIQPAPSFGTRVRSDFLQGLGQAGQKFVLLLDVDKLITPEELLREFEGDEIAALDAADASNSLLEPPSMHTEVTASAGVETPARVS